MKKKHSKKLLTWEQKDILFLVLVYVLNIVLFVGLFSILFYIDSSGNQQFFDFFKGIKNISSLIIILAFIMTAMFIFFYYEDRDFLKVASNSQMLFLILEIGILICFLTKKYINPNLRPLPFVAIITLFLCKPIKAFTNNFMFSLILLLFDCFISNSSTVDYISIATLLVNTICSGILGIYLFKDIYSRVKLLSFSFILSLPIFINVLLSSNMSSFAEMLPDLISAVFSGPLAVWAVLLFLPVLEFIFKKITCFKLAELTDHKAKYIKKMIANAPGTFNHAIVVSNLAEACATAIGEDALLARTCAYYHDIGKLRRPEFFKENQVDGNNPHDDITPELSANIIKSHTVDGYHYALKNLLPREVADVILQHHGTLPILYFYDKAKKFTDGEVSLSQYCYQGPKPQSKIAAIIMIADSCEAASRLLKDRSRENVEKTIRIIVDDRMKLGQFDECEITLKELNIIVHAITNTLSGVYHNRIEYPKVNLDNINPNSLANKQEM